MSTPHSGSSNPVGVRLGWQIISISPAQGTHRVQECRYMLTPHSGSSDPVGVRLGWQIISISPAQGTHRVQERRYHCHVFSCVIRTIALAYLWMSLSQFVTGHCAGCDPCGVLTASVLSHCVRHFSGWWNLVLEAGPKNYASLNMH